MKADFLFAVFPYLCIGVLVVGIALRYLLLRSHSATIAAEVSEAWKIFASGRLWQICTFLLIVGHLIAIFAPHSVLQWNASRGRLLLLEGVALLLGLGALIGWFGLLMGSLKRHGGSLLADLSDTVLLALLFVGVVSGLSAAVLFRYGSSWGAMILTPYLISLIQGKATPGLMVQMPFLIRLHAFSFFAALAIVPATRMGTVIVAAIQDSLAAVGKPLAAGARAGQAWFRKHNPAPWFWPEED